MEKNRNSIRDEGGLEAFDDYVGLAESDIQDMASGFSNRTTTQWRIKFDMWRVKYTLGIIHWGQDDILFSCMASLTVISNDD